ncbi:hypothetical protein [Conchiformibius kuhniae]|uniref:Uncharacterized protein n=1 Tax=Conchiformibius kuhniae TaxID=211502 RepID=A0A8T9MT05_9NEIS|nr:hypothetical protein [Conchiformibius kuhniae]UOP04737.1 hypothetical protein LVJ77_11285 [Conchiformibius kuhniae]
MTRYHAKLPQTAPLPSLLLRLLFTAAGAALLGFFLWLGWRGETRFGVMFSVFALPAAAYLFWSARRVSVYWRNRRLYREAELAVLSQPIPPRQTPQGACAWTMPFAWWWQLVRLVVLLWLCAWCVKSVWTLLVTNTDFSGLLLAAYTMFVVCSALRYVLGILLSTRRLVYEPLADEFHLRMFSWQKMRWQVRERRSANDFVGIACAWQKNDDGTGHHEIRLIARSGSRDWALGRVSNVFTDHYFVWQRAEKMAQRTGLPLLQEA